MKGHSRLALSIVAGALAIGLVAPIAAQSTTRQPPPSGSRGGAPPASAPVEPQTPPAPTAPQPQIERDDRTPLPEYWRLRPVLRIWQDYYLPATDAVRHVVVVFGDAVIEGRVEGDVVVVFGNLRLGGSAYVRGSVAVTAGDVTVAPGAGVRDDFVVVGGLVDAPTTFSPGGEHVAIGSRWLGDRLRTVMPWVTRGLLWGRLIVPDLAWVWGIALTFLLLSAAVNLVLHGPVGASATSLASRPFSTFLVGVLVLLLIGPISVLLAASIVGIIAIPFLWAAVFVAWLVGKVAVARWLGRSMTGRHEDESRPHGLLAFMLGSAAILLLYVMPVLGLITWALVGVFGLGAATLTFMAGLRRERPAPPPVPTPVPPPVSPPPVPGPPPSTGVVAGGAAAYMATPTPAVASDVPPSPVQAPPPPAAPPPYVPPAYAPSPAGAAALVTPTAMLALPRASLIERLMAIALDVGLVLIAMMLLDLRPDDDGAFPLLFFGYTILFWAWRGTTLGGIICNLRITRTNGESMRFIDALVRGLSTLFSVAALGMGMLWILRDDQRQSWQDKIAGTFVVRVPRNWPV